jgi:hypothetical protein
MTKSIVEQVENWLAENSVKYANLCSKLLIQSGDVADPIKGTVTIGAETSSRIASITFWNKGEVCVVVVDKTLRKDSVLDDRKLAPDDDVQMLLTGYFEQIIRPESPRS